MNDLCGGHDEEDKIEIIQACEEKMHRCQVRRCERLTIVNIKRGTQTEKS